MAVHREDLLWHTNQIPLFIFTCISTDAISIQKDLELFTKYWIDSISRNIKGFTATQILREINFADVF